MSYLKMDEDKTNEDVDSAINYLKLRKIKRMLLQNQLDMEKQHNSEQLEMLHRTHEHLKLMEIELTRKMGTAIIR
jgi:DNA primase